MGMSVLLSLRDSLGHASGPMLTSTRSLPPAKRGAPKLGSSRFHELITGEGRGVADFTLLGHRQRLKRGTGSILPVFGGREGSASGSFRANLWRSGHTLSRVPTDRQPL